MYGLCPVAMPSELYSHYNFHYFHPRNFSGYDAEINEKVERLCRLSYPLSIVIRQVDVNYINTYFSATTLAMPYIISTDKSLVDRVFRHSLVDLSNRVPLP